MTDFIFLDPGADVTRRDIYRLGRDLGMRIVLVSRDLGWEAEHIDDWVEADPTNPDDVLAALAARRAPAGVVNCSESCLMAAAAVTGHYRLPGLSMRVARRCRDKVLMGERLAAAGVPMARRRVVTDARQAQAAAREIGPDVVLKPSTGVASLFTIQTHAGQIGDLLHRFNAMLAARSPAPLREMGGRWLVEEYLAGPAFSVESVVTGGAARHLAICEKAPLSGPYFRELGHSTPPRLSTAGQATLTELTGQAVAALEISDCVTHTEFKWTAGGPRLLEVGARMGGGSIRQVVRHATGVDLAMVTLELAMGRTPAPRPHNGQASASRSLYPSRAGRVGRLPTEELARLPGIIAVNRWLGEGDTYLLPPDGYREVLGVVAAGADADKAIRTAEAAIAFADRMNVIQTVPESWRLSMAKNVTARSLKCLNSIHRCC
ncbi:MAG TPA: ATP-grasp domain-containing protein [Streptosporangiaceae bacterium]|nr:ATP-grasp domain-containing protein [Streptosporangiaceae bacterium]